jgi:hypothetical protein
MEAIAEMLDFTYATRPSDMEVISEIDDIIADMQELFGDGPPDSLDDDDYPENTLTVDQLVQDTIMRMRRTGRTDAKFQLILQRLEELEIPASVETMYFEAHEQL